MFVRKKSNRSGSTSVVIIDKSSGKICYLQTIEQEITSLCQQGKKWIDSHCGNRDMFRESKQQREEKQICICFVTYKVYKEFERILKISGIHLSVDKVLNIAKTILLSK
jgi:hypothetical protein